MEEGYMVDYLMGADEKIPNWAVETVFLEEVVTAIKLDIKSYFADMGLSTNGSCFSSNAYLGPVSLLMHIWPYLKRSRTNQE